MSHHITKVDHPLLSSFRRGALSASDTEMLRESPSHKSEVKLVNICKVLIRDDDASFYSTKTLEHGGLSSIKLTLNKDWSLPRLF